MKLGTALASLALAIAGTLGACSFPAQASEPATVSYAVAYAADGSLRPDVDGLMFTDTADYEADSPHCTAVALEPDVTAYACFGVPLAEAGPYADDASYDVHFTDDGELAYSNGTVLSMFRFTLA